MLNYVHYTDEQAKIWDALCELDGETVAGLFTDYHGNQLLDEGFYKFLIDEGFMEEEYDWGEDEEDE